MEALPLFDAVLAPAVRLPPLPRWPAPPAAASTAPTGSAARAPRRVLLAVDGNSLAHRAFHAYRDRGGGAYGFLALLAGLADRVDPVALVVGFDCRAASVRRDRYTGYKAGRPPKPAALDRLLDALPALLADLGVTVVQPTGWEADDVCASAASAAEGAGWRCVVTTSDRDAFALVSARTTVLRLRDGLDAAVEVTPEVLRRDVGVEPEQYVEYAALRGDTSDNLSGVRGIGQVAAAALLRAYPDVATAAEDPLGLVSVLPRGVGRRLLADLAAPRSVFRRNVALMTVRRDLPVDVDAARRRLPPERITARLAAGGLGGVAGRVALALGLRPDPVPPPDAPPA